MGKCRLAGRMSVEKLAEKAVSPVIWLDDST
jgi:hypothetical protein